jgi:hypothetical protein
MLDATLRRAGIYFPRFGLLYGGRYKWECDVDIVE